MNNNKTLIFYMLALLLTAKGALATANGVVACPSTISITATMNIAMHLKGAAKTNFDGLRTGRGALQTITFLNANLYRGSLFCNYKSTWNEGFTHNLKLRSKKNDCAKYSTGWNKIGKTCKASNPANCRVRCRP